jgi:hypothetical protein
MRNRYALVVTVSAFLAVALVASFVRSQDKPAGADAAAPAADKKQPSMEEMMQAWAKYGTPGKEHEIFKSIEGTFDADVTVTMPGAPSPEKSKGVAKNELLFGGRYVMGEFSGQMMGKPFQGGGLWAFDKLKGKYVNIWIDDMSTMVMVSEGVGDAGGKTITLTSTCPDPAGGKDKTIKSVLTVIDNDRHTYEAFESPEGKEIKTLSITYTRAKQ